MQYTLYIVYIWDGQGNEEKEGGMEGERNRGTKTYGTHTFTGIDLHDYGGQEVPQSSIFKVEEQEIQSRNLS